MAGYNTMTAEQKKNVDAKGAADYLCRAFCMIALVGIILFYGLQLIGMTEKVITILTSTVVPVIGILITLVKIFANLRPAVDVGRSGRPGQRHHDRALE